MEQNRNKKVMLSIIGVAILVIGLVGITYAFFNYTRTGTTNTIRVGRIAFNSSQAGSINLTDAFPITSIEAETDTTNAKSVSITVTGDTDYTNGVEYLVTTSDVNMTVNGKQLPIALEISVDGNNNKTLGTVETGNYYANRENYSESKYKIEYNGELEEGSHLLVGYIAPNTTSGTTEGIDGVITIKAYLDKSKILISETYDGTESDPMGTPNDQAEGKVVFTTQEWNELQQNGVSFKIKVEANDGIWVKEPVSLTSAILKNASINYYLRSYNDIIAGHPTFTTQDQVSSSATKQIVYYYMGSVPAANANVLFAGYCWQIMRTTDNGGVRMIYNGVAVDNKCETSRIATKGINGTNGASTSLNGATLFGRSYDYDLATGQFTIEESTGLPTTWSESDSNNNGKKDYEELIGTYTCKSSSATCTTLYYVGSYASSTNAYTTSYTIGDVTDMSQMGTSVFNANAGSPALIGYMFNKEYDDYYWGRKTGEYYANAVWKDGAYILSNGNGGTAPDATHHYICNNSNCTQVRYYHYASGAIYNFMVLKNGKTVAEELKEMINNKKNANDTDENINVYNSAIKGYLDNWYKKNLTEYSSYIDQASVYCNDRSVYYLGGWDPNGDLTFNLLLNQYSANRNLNCTNETDRFSKNNNKAKLEYPIGLITEPERSLMDSTYAYQGHTYWTFSPFDFSGNSANIRYVKSEVTSGDRNVSQIDGVRGVISLKPGTKLEDGTGTYDDPYIVGPLVQRDES